MYEFKDICGQFGIDLKKVESPDVAEPHFKDQDIQEIVRKFYAFCGETWGQLYEDHNLIVNGVETPINKTDILLALSSAEILVNLFLHLN